MTDDDRWWRERKDPRAVPGQQMMALQSRADLLVEFDYVTKPPMDKS